MPEDIHILTCLNVVFLNTRFSALYHNIYYRNNVERFTDQVALVNVAWVGQPSFELNTAIFVPKAYSKAQEDYPGHHGVSPVASLPIGLSETNTQGADEACLRHLKTLLESPTNSKYLSTIRTPEITKQIINTVYSFYHSSGAVRN